MEKPLFLQRLFSWFWPFNISAPSAFHREKKRHFIQGVRLEAPLQKCLQCGLSAFDREVICTKTNGFP
jgi:hypothetical protein